MRGAIELVNDVEDRVLLLLRRRVRCEQPSNPEMEFGARSLGDQAIGRLMDAVVEEPIGTLGSKDEARLDCLPELTMHLLLFVLKDLFQQCEVRATAQACKLLQYFPGFDR